MTYTLDKLEKKGLIKRVANPEDRRSIQIQISNKGVNTYKELSFHYANSIRKELSKLSEEEQFMLLVFLKKIV